MFFFALYSPQWTFYSPIEQTTNFPLLPAKKYDRPDKTVVEPKAYFTCPFGFYHWFTAMLAWKYCSHRTDFLCFNWDLGEFFWISLDRFNYTAFLCKSAPFIVHLSHTYKKILLYSRISFCSLWFAEFSFCFHRKPKGETAWREKALYCFHATFRWGKVSGPSIIRQLSSSNLIRPSLDWLRFL